MGDCFRCPRTFSAFATEVVATSSVAAAAPAVVRRRFLIFWGEWVLSGPGRPGHRRARGFSRGPMISTSCEFRKWVWCLKTRQKCGGRLYLLENLRQNAPYARKKTPISRAELRRRGEKENGNRGWTQIYAERERGGRRVSRGGAETQRVRKKGTAATRRFAQTGPEKSPLPLGATTAWCPRVRACVPLALPVPWVSVRIPPSEFRIRFAFPPPPSALWSSLILYPSSLVCWGAGGFILTVVYSCFNRHPDRQGGAGSLCATGATYRLGPSTSLPRRNASHGRRKDFTSHEVH